MRILLIGISALALAACSQQHDQAAREAPAAESADAAAGAPGVNVTAAPGVAFTYAYDFRLPAERIGAAQEAHATACEKLGIARCRITGMRYALSDRGGIDAMLTFKLDPTLARAFGKEGIAAIEKYDGMLTRADITGTDAGGEIERIGRQRADLAEQRARIDRELARPGLSASERAELQRQRAELDNDDRGQRAASRAQQDSLATTPMTFQYESGTAINAFGGKGMLARALDSGVQSINTTLAVALTALAVLGPPALLIALLAYAYLWFRRRYWPHRRAAAAAGAPPTPTADA